MKVEIDLIRSAVEAARDESLREVQEEPAIADFGDKMYNFGIHHMFYMVLSRLDEIEKIAKEVSA